MKQTTRDIREVKEMLEQYEILRNAWIDGTLFHVDSQIHGTYASKIVCLIDACDNIINLQYNLDVIYRTYGYNDEKDFTENAPTDTYNEVNNDVDEVLYICKCMDTMKEMLENIYMNMQDIDILRLPRA